MLTTVCTVQIYKINLQAGILAMFLTDHHAQHDHDEQC